VLVWSDPDSHAVLVWSYPDSHAVLVWSYPDSHAVLVWSYTGSWYYVCTLTGVILQIYAWRENTLVNFIRIMLNPDDK
jgi:hypothetical protein